MIKDIEKLILELENMEKNKMNKIKTIMNDTIKRLDVARMEEIKNLEEIRIEIKRKYQRQKWKCQKIKKIK